MGELDTRPAKCGKAHALSGFIWPPRDVRDPSGSPHFALSFSRGATGGLLSSMGKTPAKGAHQLPGPPWPVREVAMPSVLVVNEISTEREEIARALEGEGFTVVQAQSAAEAVREIWGGNFM